MSNTREMLSQVRDYANTANAPDQSTVVQGTQRDRRDNTENDPTITAEPLETANERVAGVAYVATYQCARTNKWRMRGSRPEGRAGHFVYERPDHTGGRKFVTLATLGPEFRLRSSLLADDDEDESWRTDVTTSETPVLFPNLDVLLANARDSPRDFVHCFIDQGWATSADAVGPLADRVEQHTQLPTVQQRLQENPASHRILIMDALLSFAQGADGRKGDTLWAGCPVFPQQLLVAIQKRVANQTGSTWRLPAPDQTVTLVGEIVQITDQARRLAKSIVLNKTADWSEVEKLAVRAQLAQESIQLFTDMAWEEACTAARSSDLSSTLQLLQERARRRIERNSSHPDRLNEGWRLPFQRVGNPDAPTFVLTREPSDGDPKITPAEREELEEACKQEKTMEIPLEKVRLLTESTGTAIISLQPGGEDITRVKMPYYAEALLMKVHEELAPEDSLRKVPLVALAKIFSLRMTQNDSFVYEHLGLLVTEDFSTDVSLTKPRGAAQNAQVIRAKRHKWAAVNTMEDFANVVEGLAICAKRLHHPSVLSHQEIFDLWAKLKALFVHHGGHAHVTGMFNVFKTRIEEHALAVRSRSVGAPPALPPLQQLQSRSQLIYNKVREAAKQECLRDYAALRSGQGETAWGALRSGSETIDADGKRAKHVKPPKPSPTPGTPRLIADTAPPTAPAGTSSTKRAAETGASSSRPKSASKKTKRAPAEGHPCVRCAKIGHPWFECIEREWCPIPQVWPGFLKSLAARVRTDHGVKVLYISAGGQKSTTPGTSQA